MSEKHQWSREDHIIAYYLYRFGMESLGDPKLLLERLGISISSMTMKFANLISAKYGETDGKFRTSEMDRWVVQEFSDKSELEHRKDVLKFILQKLK